jgi:hypothetical protein
LAAGEHVDSNIELEANAFQVVTDALANLAVHDPDQWLPLHPGVTTPGGG